MRTGNLLFLLAGISFGQSEPGPAADTAAQPPIAAPAPVAQEAARPAAPDTTRARVSRPSGAQESVRSESSVAKGADENWQLTLDFGDVAETGRVMTRHFHQSEHQSNLCCVDVAWYPWSAGEGKLRAGGFANVGGWNQNLMDQSSVMLADLTLGGSVLGAIPLGSIVGLWARADLGVSNLVIHRHITGMDWGLGSAIRAGLSLHPWGHTLFAGAGMDWRDYLNVDLKAVPAVTLFLGGWF